MSIVIDSETQTKLDDLEAQCETGGTCAILSDVSRYCLYCWAAQTIRLDWHHFHRIYSVSDPLARVAADVGDVEGNAAFKCELQMAVKRYNDALEGYQRI